MRISTPAAFLVSALALTVSLQTKAANVPDGRAYKGKKLIARTYNSGFDDAHDTYNGMGAASAVSTKSF
jgi:hypothetical protein